MFCTFEIFNSLTDTKICASRKARHAMLIQSCDNLICLPDVERHLFAFSNPAKYIDATFDNAEGGFICWREICLNKIRKTERIVSHNNLACKTAFFQK
jgi:hypothetical protein